MWRFVLLLCLFAAEVSAEPVAEPAAKPVIAKPGIEVEAWARATPPGATTGAIYGRFTDTAGKSWLAEGIKVPFAGHVMVHKTSNEEGMMRMRHTQLRIEAGETVVLEPGSTHIMLMGLQTPLREGCRYSFDIIWQDGSSSSHSLMTGGYGQSSAPSSNETDSACP